MFQPQPRGGGLQSAATTGMIFTSLFGALSVLEKEMLEGASTAPSSTITSPSASVSTVQSHVSSSQQQQHPSSRYKCLHFLFGGAVDSGGITSPVTAGCGGFKGSSNNNNLLAVPSSNATAGSLSNSSMPPPPDSASVRTLPPPTGEESVLIDINNNPSLMILGKPASEEPAAAAAPDQTSLFLLSTSSHGSRDSSGGVPTGVNGSSHSTMMMIEKTQEYVRWKTVMQMAGGLSFRTQKGTLKGRRGNHRYDGLRIEELLLSHKQQREDNKVGGGGSSPSGRAGSGSGGAGLLVFGALAAPSGSNPGSPLHQDRSEDKSTAAGKRSSPSPSLSSSVKSGVANNVSSGFVRVGSAIFPMTDILTNHHNPLPPSAHHSTPSPSSISINSLVMSAVLRSDSKATLTSRSATGGYPPLSDTSINLIDPAGTSMRSLVSAGDSIQGLNLTGRGSQSATAGLTALMLQPAFGDREHQSVGGGGSFEELTEEISSNPLLSLPTSLGDVYLRICLDQEIPPIRSLMNHLTQFPLTLTSAQFAASQQHGAGDSDDGESETSSYHPTLKPFNLLGKDHNLVAPGADGAPMEDAGGAAGQDSGIPLLNAEMTTFDLTPYACGPEGAFAALGVLLHTPNVETIKMKGCRLHDKTVEFLCLVAAQALPRLRSIDLSGNPRLSLGAGKALQRFVSLPTGSVRLRSLIATGTNIRAGCLRSIAEHIKRRVDTAQRLRLARWAAVTAPTSAGGTETPRSCESPSSTPSKGASVMTAAASLNTGGVGAVGLSSALLPPTMPSQAAISLFEVQL